VVAAKSGQKTPDGYYNVERMLKGVVAGKGQILLCTTCMDARGLADAEIMAGAGRDLPVAACIDTAHTFAAGYPIHTAPGLKSTLEQLDRTIGLGNVRVIHANDSKTALGSHVDRHQHIGKGEIGVEAFRRIVRHPKLKRIPFICETPIDRPGDDKRNLRVMRSLAGVEAGGKRR